MLNRRTLMAAAAAAPLAAFFTRPAVAAEPYVFAVDGIAIRGADPVAYLSQGEPVQGSRDHALMWGGATWHFSSAANMELFMADPRAYAPQYGGYCAYAASQGYVASTVPEAWTIHEGKLYLNFSLGVRRRWARDIPGHIASGDANWPALLA
ncbi:hypothetical protein OAN307_c14080 [Octadecabacter antarcticus 307]|uniref:YHS domain-containing protein n=1 Tax=Octadecabacter antarcticus 307 TaxID=391626 RepID=M9R9N6_9RHOB|nr:YHS domain-containing (seleno)protein [Octadecabacter antarcticus]AGI67086.1 hypothetical protein OAN307_c14080 [Octadecabacter antarcticus 307]